MINSHSDETPSAETMRCAVYCRYSSPLQRATSVEDQLRNCCNAAAKRGWIVLDEYIRCDREQSGKWMHRREGVKSLIEDAARKPRPFDYVLVDDSSRLGRNLVDVRRTVEVLSHYGVHVLFASDNLDSRNDGIFRISHTFRGLMDEEFSRVLGEKVHRGQVGRVLKGMCPGGACFGYRNIPIPDPSRIGEHGRAATLGVRYEVVESHAETIRRIYEMFASGISIGRITRALNVEKVPAPREPKYGQRAAWIETTVAEILRNEKYIGRLSWNRSKQRRHPETGSVLTTIKPKEEHVCVEVPHLRIVDDELWARVQERWKIVAERIKNQRLGGLNKAKRPYLFGGLLACGVCGGPIVTKGASSQGALYACKNARNRTGCTNTLSIRERRLVTQLLEALETKLLSKPTIDYLVDSVCVEVNNYLEDLAKAASTASKGELLERKVDLEQRVERLASAIEDPAGSQSESLIKRLVAAEAELNEVKKKLSVSQNPNKQKLSPEGVKKAVHARVKDLLTLIDADPEQAKHALQQHIQKLVLYPVDTSSGPMYEVSGDIDLFAFDGLPGLSEMLPSSSAGIPQHFTSEFQLSFVSLQINPGADHYSDEYVDGSPFANWANGSEEVEPTRMAA